MLTDTSGRSLVGDRNPRPDSPVYNLWTSSTGVDGGLGVDLPKVDRLHGGTFTGSATRPGREITLAGTAVFDDDAAGARRFVDTVAGMLSAGGAGLLVRVSDGGERSVLVELDGPPKVAAVIEDDTSSVDWELQLYAADPVWHGPPIEARVADYTAMQGLLYPLHVGTPWLDYRPGDASQATVPLRPGGNAPAYPVFTVEGSFPSGFAVGFEGAEVVYEAAVVPGVPVVVDFAGRVTAGGVDQGWRLGVRRWGGVDAGAAFVPWFRPLVATAQTAGVATCRVRPAWI